MVDTQFSALSATDTIQPTDALVIVRGGVPHRFTGRLPAISADGTLDVFGPSQQQILLRTANTEYFRIGRNAGNGIMEFYGSQAGANGYLFGGADGDRLAIEVGGAVRPGGDNTQSSGTAPKRWSVIYAGSGVINTSDKRDKQQIGDIPEAWLDAWEGVRWCRFKFNDAVAAKGDDARWHVGLVAQQVHAAFEVAGIDAFEIGLVCWDRWRAKRAVCEKRNAKGVVMRPARSAEPAGDRWGLRYDQAFAIEAAWQRRERLRDRLAIDDLRARLAALEGAEPTSEGAPA